MNYKLEKYISGGIIAVIYFFIRSYFWNMGIRDNLLTLGYTEEEALLECIMTGYFTTQEVVLIGTLCMILYVEYAAGKDEAMIMLRYENRNKYLLKKIEEVFLAGFIFCFIRVFTGLVFLQWEFGRDMIFTKEMFHFACWFLIISFLYTAHCSMIYMILKDYTHKKTIALMIMMIGQTTLYFIYQDQWLYFLLHREITWVPFCDLDAPAAVFAGLVGNSENMLVAFRQLCIALLVALLWTGTWRKRDVIQIEK